MVKLHVRGFQKDVVYIFQFSGNATVPSLSPFCIKVEAFCRLHNLQFERKNTSTRGANGLLPFIELNGQHTADSHFILHRLTEYFHLPTIDGLARNGSLHFAHSLAYLTGERTFPDEHSEGIAHAVERMIENHLLHLLRLDMGRTMTAMARQYLEDNNAPSFLIPAAAAIGGWSLRRKLSRVARTALGRFTEEQYDEMLRYDLLQLQNVLGDHQFLMSDEPSRVDCIALAHIGLAYYAVPQARSRIHELLDSQELTELKAYLGRAVERIFGDDFNDKK